MRIRQTYKIVVESEVTSDSYELNDKEFTPEFVIATEQEFFQDNIEYSLISLLESGAPLNAEMVTEVIE